MKNLSFRQKLWLPLIVSIVVLLVVSLISVWQLQSVRLDERKNDLRNLGNMALSIVADYGKLAESGKMTLEDAQKQAMLRVAALRFGTDGYFLITNTDVVTLMHPIKPELTGKNLRGFKDSNGAPVFQLIAEAGKVPGGAFVSYVWPRTAGGASVPKLSFVIGYEPWKWHMTTGAYTDDIDAAFYQSLWKSGIFVMVSVLLLSLTIGWSARSTQRLIGGDPQHAADFARRISAGDLTAHIETAPDDHRSLIYEIRMMAVAMINTITAIRESSTTIAGASQEIASGNQDLSHRTELQASSLEKTASAMEQLTSTVRQNADNAREASQLAVSASDIAVQGGKVVNEVIETMLSIDQSSHKIVDIISVINSIAFQTNILALNAAVEAARAGEQGRGFAVVASEVRSLAQRSATAAREIKALIDDSVSKVSTGSRLVHTAGVTMDQVVSSVRSVTNIVAEISVASREQSQGIDDIGHAVVPLCQASCRVLI